MPTCPCKEMVRRKGISTCKKLGNMSSKMLQAAKNYLQKYWTKTWALV